MLAKDIKCCDEFSTLQKLYQNVHRLKFKLCKVASISETTQIVFYNLLYDSTYLLIKYIFVGYTVATQELYSNRFSVTNCLLFRSKFASCLYLYQKVKLKERKNRGKKSERKKGEWMIGRKWEGMLYSISLSNEIVPKFRLIPLIGISS